MEKNAFWRKRDFSSLSLSVFLKYIFLKRKIVNMTHGLHVNIL